MTTVNRTALAFAFGLAIALSFPVTSAAELKPGDVLNKDTAAQAEGLLPPEILQHYKDGKYENKIVEWPEGKFRWETAFEEATIDNKGKYDVNERGTIIDKSTVSSRRTSTASPSPTSIRATRRRAPRSSGTRTTATGTSGTAVTPCGWSG